MLKQRMALALAAVAVVSGSAWGYGVEGWPNGTPDHVLNAGKNTHSAPAEHCSCCKSLKKDCKNASACK